MIKLIDLLYEVFDSYYPVKDREMTEPPKAGHTFERKRIGVFHAEGKKFIIETYQYANHFYLVAFYPKLNRDFYKNKYRIQMNLKNQFTVLSTVFRYMKQLMEKDPLASVGFYGAPDLEDKDPNYSTHISKRYRIYIEMIKQFEMDVDHNLIKDPNLSAVMLINKEYLKQAPDLVKFGEQAMDDAIM
jgi:hypothetical protein